jgi:UDP-N-acetylmuramoylalanine--D-glutamate ligase
MHNSNILKADFWNNRRVVVLGAARSGVAAASFLKHKHNQVSISDSGAISESIKQELKELGIDWEEGGHTPELLSQAEALVVSPGIPITAPPFRLAAEKQIPILSEIELAGQFLNTPVIAVTGSNGKTTTVTLIKALLEEAGFKTGLGGNIGTPLISFAEQNLDWVVAELSSFQLETTYSFKPKLALLLNVYPNHLDRHPSIENYFEIKCRIFQAQDDQDWALSNSDNHWCQNINSQQPLHWFSRQPGENIFAWIENEQLYRQTIQGPEAVFKLSELPLLGSHNHENYLAMLAISARLEIPLPALQRAIVKIKGIPHRLERVAEIEGRIFINDSKATNYLATLKALESLEPPLILIAGGRDKGGDFGPLAALIQARAKAVVLVGEAAGYFAQELAKTGYNQISIAGSMQDAVTRAWQISQPQDQILLSPACTSYDMFADFEERGEKFKTSVTALTH